MSGPPTLDDLKAEHKRKYIQVMEDLGKEVLKQYTWTCIGGIRYIGDPERLLAGSTCLYLQRSAARHFGRRSTT